MIGQQIDGKYVVTGVLGSGAMGAVYEARNLATGRTVAVKVIQSGLGTDPALVARFQREARAAGAIESTYIAQVLDAGQDRSNEAPYLVMELLKGEDLDTLARRLGTMRYDLALRIIGQALAGLEKAHGVGVVHRDIKPANLYIAAGDGGQRVVKLVDFGIAKVKDELAASNHALTQTSALLGSPLYMSPEQAKASKKVDARADLWSLGIVLYQLLTGKAPHSHAESLTELLLAICTEDIKPVQQEAPWVPAPVAEIVERALKLDPSKRFDSALQMRDAITAIVPDWYLLTEAMLTPITAEERSFIAEPSASLSALGVSTGPAGRGILTASGASSSNSALALGGATNLLPLEGSSSSSSTPSAASASQHSAPALARSAGAGAVLGAQSQSGVARRGARVMPFAIVGVAVVLGLGFVGLRTLGSTKGDKASATGMVETPATNGATSATASAAATGSASATTTTTTTTNEADGGSPIVASAVGSATAGSATNGSATSATAVHPSGSSTHARPGASGASATGATASTAASAGTGVSAATTSTTKPTTAPTSKPTTPAASSTSPISREFN